jgi:hypothetical protein
VIAGEAQNRGKPEFNVSDLFSIWQEGDFRIAKQEHPFVDHLDSVNVDEKASLLHQKENVQNERPRGSFLYFIGMFLLCLVFPFLVPVPLLLKNSKNFTYGKKWMRGLFLNKCFRWSYGFFFRIYGLFGSSFNFW